MSGKITEIVWPVVLGLSFGSLLFVFGFAAGSSVGDRNGLKSGCAEYACDAKTGDCKLLWKHERNKESDR